MNSYDRIFGSGPRGALIAITLLVLTYYLEDFVGLRIILSNDAIRFSIIAVLSLFGTTIFIWSLVSLPPKDRGMHLVTTGAYKYFRHPLYAAFLLFLNVGFAFLLNNLIYLIWALTLFPVWSMNVRSEEKSMADTFGKAYEEYCQKTRRFFPTF